MKTLLLALAATVIGLVADAHSEESVHPLSAPILVADSRSPDNRLEIVVTTPSDEDIAHPDIFSGAPGTLHVRECKSRKLLGGFSWYSYEDATENPFELSWRADSRAFAVTYHSTIHKQGCQVGVRADDGRFYEAHSSGFRRWPTDKVRFAKHIVGESFAGWLPHRRFATNCMILFADDSDGFLIGQFPIHVRAASPKFSIVAVKREL